MVEARYQKLFEPGRIGSLGLKNRLVMPPMATNFGNQEGYVTQRMLDYYEERARAGVGLVIVEFSCVDSPVGRALPGQPLIDDDRFIPGLAGLASAIERHGARAAIQLAHAGRQTEHSVTGHRPVAPSAIAAADGELPAELTASEIEAIVRRFSEAALRAKLAGFDGVEIHGAHGYLISQFLSPLSNRRLDAYGGSVENRARMLLEVLKAAREKVGIDFPLWCRLSAAEMLVEGGITLEETQAVARLAEKAGADAIHVSAHAVGYGRRPPMAQPAGAFLSLAEGIKKAVSVPVIAVSRIPPELGEKVLREGKADFVAIGRGLLTEPRLPEKILAEREGDIRPCLYCLTCLHTLRTRDDGIVCVVNAALGKEREYGLTPAEHVKKVVVVGGGPGGMEAARVASHRGHRVILFDEGDQLGGQLLIASKPPFKDTLETFRRYLAGQMSRLAVEVHLKTKFTVDSLRGLRPDAVVLATGVVPLIPQIPGIQATQVLLAEDVLSGAGVGDRVAVIGGELVGCETALYLVEQGRKVTIMRRGSELATRVNPFTRVPLIGRLQTKGVSILTEVEYEEVAGVGVVVRTKEGERRIIEADTVVLAAGAMPNTELLSSIQGMVSQVFSVGDCVEPRSMREAIADGYQAGLAL